MGRRRFPEFKSMRELVRFVDNPETSLSEYDLATLGEPVEIDVDEESLRLQEDVEYRRSTKLRPVTMRLDEKLVVALKRIASRRSISYQTLARMWLRERAIEELRAQTVYPVRAAKGAWSRGVGEQTRVEQLLAQVDADLDEVRGLLQHRGSRKTRQRRRRATAKPTRYRS